MKPCFIAFLNQVWQWLHHNTEVGGQPLTLARFDAVLEEEAAALKKVRHWVDSSTGALAPLY